MLLGLLHKVNPNAPQLLLKSNYFFITLFHDVTARPVTFMLFSCFSTFQRFCG